MRRVADSCSGAILFAMMTLPGAYAAEGDKPIAACLQIKHVAFLFDGGSIDIAVFLPAKTGAEDSGNNLSTQRIIFVKPGTSLWRKFNSSGSSKSLVLTGPATDQLHVLRGQELQEMRQFAWLAYHGRCKKGETPLANREVYGVLIDLLGSDAPRVWGSEAVAAIRDGKRGLIVQKYPPVSESTAEDGP